VAFKPVVPKYTAGFALQTIEIHIRDHKQRELAIRERTLEAHYGGFVLSETISAPEDARRRALETSYGPAGSEVLVAGHAGKSYERGPEVAPDDIDGRMPAVVVWSDDEMFYLVASGELEADVLLRVAGSLYG
jgi:hypothetical protein